MNFIDPTTLLIAAAACPILGGLTTCMAVTFGQQKLGLQLARLGFIGGLVGGAILAFELHEASNTETAEVRLELWTWFSFAAPQSPSVTFGLQANWIKSCAISVAGVFAIIATWSTNSQTRWRRTDDAILTVSLLYTATVVFAFAPNTIQAFIGWAAFSLLTLILFQQFRESAGKSSSLSNKTGQSKSFFESNGIQSLRGMGMTVVFLERFTANNLWNRATKSFPNWIAEQLEELETGQNSLQLLTSVLGTFAIILTWLL